MKATFNTIRDIVDESHEVVQVDHNTGDLDTPLNRVGYLLYNPHARPLLDTKADLRVPALPRSVASLKAFLQTRVGREVLAYSYLRADTGSTEIGKAIMAILAERGEAAVMLSSPTIGRGVLDVNRPLDRAIDFPVPNAVRAELMRVYDTVRSVLRRTFAAIQPDFYRSTPKGVFQPHTMGSGDLTDVEGERFEALTGSIKPTAEGYEDTNATLAALEELSALYDLMNNRRDRPRVDVLKSMVRMGSDARPVKVDGRIQLDVLPDRGGHCQRLARELEAAGIPWAYDKPFPHVPSYPGSVLAQAAADADIPQGTLDVPRYLLQTDPGARVDTLTFQPDPERVKLIAQAVVRAFGS